MKLQKNFFLLIVVIAVSMIAFTDDVTFPLGFLTFVISLFTLSTISYDEFDNGNAFLFTLPITRTNYVVEKYCLSLLLGCSTWIVATVLTMIASISCCGYNDDCFDDFTDYDYDSSDYDTVST